VKWGGTIDRQRLTEKRLAQHGLVDAVVHLQRVKAGAEVAADLRAAAHTTNPVANPTA